MQDWLNGLSSSQGYMDVAQDQCLPSKWILDNQIQYVFLIKYSLGDTLNLHRPLWYFYSIPLSLPILGEPYIPLTSSFPHLFLVSYFTPVCFTLLEHHHSSIYFWFPISFLSASSKSLALIPTSLCTQNLYPNLSRIRFPPPHLFLSAQATLARSQASATICRLGLSHSPRWALTSHWAAQHAVSKPLLLPFPPLISKSPALSDKNLWFYDSISTLLPPLRPNRAWSWSHRHLFFSASSKNSSFLVTTLLSFLFVSLQYLPTVFCSLHQLLPMDYLNIPNTVPSHTILGSSLFISFWESSNPGLPWMIWRCHILSCLWLKKKKNHSWYLGSFPFLWLPNS